MSDVFTKRQPMVDFDERRLCPPRFTDQKVGDLLAELFGPISDNGGPHKASFESKTQLSAKAGQGGAESGEWKQADAQVQLAYGDFAAIKGRLLGTRQPKAAAILPGAEGSPAEHKRPTPPAPFIGGDFAAIEAGLLGALQEQATATVSQSGTAKAFPSVNVRPKGRLDRENRPAPRRDRRADGQKRSWRSFPVLAAITFVGMAGTAAISGLTSWPSEPGIESIRADNGTNERQMEAASGADVPAQDAPILRKLPEPSPRVLVKGNEQTFSVPQSEETTPAADSQVQLDNGAAPAPAPLSEAAPVESNTVKADLATPDGAPRTGGAPPRANTDGPALVAPQSPAATQAPAAAERAAKSLKRTTAKHRSDHGQLHQIANKAKPAQRSPLHPETAPGTGPETQSQSMQPSPATDGAFGFLQNAVNSLTSVTAKLFGGTN